MATDKKRLYWIVIYYIVRRNLDETCWIFVSSIFWLLDFGCCWFSGWMLCLYPNMMSWTPSEHKPLSAAMRSNFLRFAVSFGCKFILLGFHCVWTEISCVWSSDSELKLAWLPKLQKNNEEIQTKRYFCFEAVYFSLQQNLRHNL